jgi:hypothetical protein
VTVSNDCLRDCVRVASSIAYDRIAWIQGLLDGHDGVLAVTERQLHVARQHGIEPDRELVAA